MPTLSTCQGGEVVERAAGVAQCGGADREGEVAEDGEPVQRAVDARAVEEREHALGRHEQLVGDGVVAAGAAQAERVPGVEHRELGARDADDPRTRVGVVAGHVQPAKNSSAWVMPLQ